jgi:hypothetical protein
MAFQNSTRYETLGRIEEEKSPRSTTSSISDSGGGESAESRQDKPAFEVSAEATEIQDILSKNEELRRKCNDLEESMAQLQNEGDVFKMKTSMTLSMYQSKLDLMVIDKEALAKQCGKLEDEMTELRNRNFSKQLEILAFESRLNQ